MGALRGHFGADTPSTVPPPSYIVPKVPPLGNNPAQTELPAAHWVGAAPAAGQTAGRRRQRRTDHRGRAGGTAGSGHRSGAAAEQGPGRLVAPAAPEPQANRLPAQALSSAAARAGCRARSGGTLARTRRQLCRRRRTLCPKCPRTETTLPMRSCRPPTGRSAPPEPFRSSRRTAGRHTERPPSPGVHHYARASP